MTTVFRCMEGLGDNLYTRPFVREFIERNPDEMVLLETCVPEFYEDLAVKFVAPKIRYRTQQKNYAPWRWVNRTVGVPEDAKEVVVFYGQQDLKKHSIIGAIESKFGFDVGSTKPVFDLPEFFTRSKLKKLAVIRPVTHRAEWLCTTRSPRPNYIAWCSRILMEAGYHVVSIADTEPDVEWIVGEAPPAHERFHHGELTISQTLQLIQNAELVVGGSGFIIPAAISANTNLFVIFGGRGMYDNPHKVFDLRMDMSKIGWAIPENFCRCNWMEHDCDKNIKNLDDQFFRFMRTIQSS